MQISTYLYVSLNAMLAWQDSHFYVGDGDQLISPSSCSQVLEAIVTHTKNHTQNSLNVLWSQEMNLSTGNRIEKSSFLSKVSLKLQPRRWCVKFFSLAPLRVQSSELTTAKATVTSAENQATGNSSENTNLRAEVARRDGVHKN